MASRPLPAGQTHVIGDPTYSADDEYNLAPLPGARAEAKAVAALVSADPLLGDEGTKRKLHDLLDRAQPSPDLLYFATHGVADPVNPLDGGLLWFADGRWAAREIQNLPLRVSQPLVVLSACQTGLGKTFEVGVVGMAQAWQRAGARSLVMSLWRVDDVATRDLMTAFMREALTQPPDRALQKAMQGMRKKDQDPAHWASFAVYGLPGR